MLLNKLKLQKDYSLSGSGYQLKLPLNLETVIPSDDSVRLLSQFVEEMDLTALYATYERIRNHAASPKQMLKIVLYAAMNRMYSSRDIFDWKNGKRIAGMLTEDRTAFADSPEEMRKSMEEASNRFVENTTLGVIITNARFHKGSLCKIAGMGHDGYARSIRPVHTSLDGDSIYAVSVGDVVADREVVGLMAAEVVSEAIIRAVEHADSAYGFPAANALKDYF